MQQLEEQLETTETDMYSMIYADDIQLELSEVCSSAALQEAQSYASILRTNLEASYADETPARVLIRTADLYAKLKHSHDRANSADTDLFCALKYILYDIQDYLRDRHISLLKETGIVNDFDGFSDELYGYQTKRRTLDYLIANNQHWQDQIDADLTFTTENELFYAGLSSRKQHLLNQVREIMELMVYKALAKLIDKDILTSRDASLLQDEFVIQYVDSCDIFHGSYEMKETKDSQGNHIRYDIQQMLLKVNLCTNYFILRDIDQIFEKIAVHELGHHFYYYHDDNPDAFLDICWSSQNQKNGHCTSDEYVSDYAQARASEDYAEHFMHWALDILPEHTSAVMSSKTEHFSTIVE